MQSYTAGGKVYISVNNIEEFKELIRKANNQSKELQKTIDEINGFDLEVEFVFGDK